MSKIVGIDLGTTNSEVAIIQDGKPVVIPVDGSPILPSVVGLSPNGEILVGQEARNQYILDPENTIRSIKRKMGMTEKVKLGKKEYLPEEISAFILKKLKGAAEAYLKEPVEKAVITVPAYFTDAQRQATKKAGELAGLDVVRILNEPTAAALAFGLGRNLEHHILVYDLGGGTFDVSIVEIQGDVFEVKASHGDTHLGGDDFDQLLIDDIAEGVKEDRHVDLREQRKALARLTRSVEQAKMTLSSHPFAQIKEEFIARSKLRPVHLDEEVSRTEFEILIEQLLQKTVTCLRQCLSDAKLDPAQINKIILAGGSTRIPRIHELLEAELGQLPHSEINPDLCVAMGAAIQAGIISNDKIDAILIDVTAHSLGIAVLDFVLGTYVDDRFSKIISRNTVIPTSKSEVYSTVYENQKSVKIDVYQGENPIASKNTLLGSFLIEGLTPALAGEVKVVVKFDYDVNGIVHVTATEKGTKNEKQMDVSVTRPQSMPELALETFTPEPETETETETAPEMRLAHEELHQPFQETIERAEAFIERKQNRQPEEVEHLASHLQELKEAIVSEDFEHANTIEKHLIALLSSFEG